MKINFVSNYFADDMGGGWNGTNGNTYRALGERFAVSYVGPIVPPTPFLAKAASKLTRLAGGRGAMPVYGPGRLAAVAAEHAARRDPAALFDEFHGATPWVRCRPPVPYGVYMDATFPQYVEVYAQPTAFSPADLARIEREEGEFLRGAAVLFFGSDWVRDDAQARYGTDPVRARTIYTGGKVPLPTADAFAGGFRFLFISLNFERKGGRIAAGALQRVRARVAPEAELVVLGERPPEDVMALPGVSYGGMLRKSVPEELDHLVAHLAAARGLIHPTAQDTMGSVLIEAAYHGCPAVTTRRFGVPEFVRHGETGWLVDPPVREDDIAAAVSLLCEDGERYAAMRRTAFRHAHDNLTWSAFGRRMADGIEAVVRA